MFGEDLRPLTTSDLTMSYNQMKVASDRIGELERQEMRDGRSRSAMALGRIKRTLRQAMDDAVEQGQVSPEIADAYRHATQQYAQYAGGGMPKIEGDRMIDQGTGSVSNLPMTATQQATANYNQGMLGYNQQNLQRQWAELQQRQQQFAIEAGQRLHSLTPI